MYVNNSLCVDTTHYMKYTLKHSRRIHTPNQKRVYTIFIRSIIQNSMEKWPSVTKAFYNDLFCKK